VCAKTFLTLTLSFIKERELKPLLPLLREKVGMRV